MIYTGNNGRIYIARDVDAGLQGTFTTNVLPDIRPGPRVYNTFFVRNIAGDGRGARVRIDRNMFIGTTPRTAIFTVISRGTNYEAGDVVRFAYRDGKGNIVDVTGNITISTTATVGVDNEREILDDKYRIAKIRNWNLTSNSEIVETTSLGDAVKSFNPSVTSAEGSATLMFYEDDITGRGDAKQLDTFELIDLLFPRTTPARVIMNLAVDGSTTGAFSDVGGAALWKTNFLFHAYITSASLGVNYGEVVTIDTSFTVDGTYLDVPWKINVNRL
jgi:hypothetical protein